MCVNTDFQIMWPASQLFGVCTCFFTWGRVGDRRVTRLCVFLIGTRRGLIGWFGYLVISRGWCVFLICRQTIRWCGFLTRVPARWVGWFGSLSSRRPVFYMGCSVVCVRACVSTLKRLKLETKRGVGVKWTQAHLENILVNKEKKNVF